MGTKKSIDINKYKKERQLNIGIFIFAIVFVYLIVAIIMYASSKNISTYEVREGSILRDNSYTGLIIRDETVVPAESSGYINFFQNEYSKMKNGAPAYAITSDKIAYEDTSVEEPTALSPEKQRQLAVRIQGFNENYDSARFHSAYSLKDEIATNLMDSSNNSKTTQIDALLDAEHSDAHVYPTSADGILFLHMDGYESVTLDSFKPEHFDRNLFKQVSRQDNSKISSGDPAYKLITSEKWYILVELKDDAVAEFADIESVKTRINKDTSTLWAEFSVIQRDGKYFGCLGYDNSMIRYAGDRFVNIELIMEDESGLKIPKSSVVEKQFYQIPIDYLTVGGNSNDFGVMIEDKRGNVTFQAATIYKETEEGFAYIGTSKLSEGTVIVKPESPSVKMTLSSTSPLKGVYNVNKGYAVFKQISVLTESDDYFIIRPGDKYGIHDYDHIVQDGKMVEENEVVFQ